MSRILCALVAIVAGGLMAETSPALGAFPGENGDIAFAGYRDADESGIWTITPDGSGSPR
jgi:hypothetical protein